ncbi:porin family protein [Mangrovibacterium sp.]|uniref:porin family protein n=1 Tax=Mangrovibacterium sp. TaxID=1961364 RepID=UPI003563D544
MKKSLLLIVFLFALQFGYAKSDRVNLGLKAGFNTSKIKTDYEQFNDGSVNNFLVGAFARINMNRVYFQPELYFTSKGGELKDVEAGGTESFDLSSIDIPILLGAKIIEKKMYTVRIDAGPVMSFITKKSETDSDETFFDVDDLKDSYMGIQYGVGVDMWILSLDARIENSFGDFSDGSGKEKSKSFLFTLGIRF